jgi:hypothetical protein
VDGLASIILLLAWGYGVVTLGWSVRRWSPSRSSGPPAVRVVGACGLLAVLGSLLMPWVSGVGAGGEVRLVLRGWTGLDPLTVMGVVALAVPAAAYLLVPGAGGPGRRSIRAAQALCLLGLLGGNALIQASSVTTTSLDIGGIVGTAGALLLVVSVGPDRPTSARVGSPTGQPVISSPVPGSPQSVQATSSTSSPAT